MPIPEIDSRRTALARALIAVSWAAPTRAQSSAATGAITLTLADDSGVAEAGASVSIRKGPTLIEHAKGYSTTIPPGPHAQTFVTSDSNGRLSAPILDPGEYGVCVTVPPALGIVSPCK